MRFRFTITAALFLVLSCGKTSSVSHLHGALNSEVQKCFDYPKARYEQLDGQLKDVEIFKGFLPEERPELLKHFYAVPPEYRDVLITRFKEGTFEGILKEDIDSAGNCRFDDYSCIRIQLSSTLKDVIEYSLIHEVGHGVQRVAARKLGLTNAELDTRLQELMAEARLHNEGAGKQKELNIREYSLSNEKEFFSDSFHNYYCSPKSHDFVKAHLPKNYAFLKEVLVEPLWIDEPRFLNPLGAEYMEAVTALFNEASKTCDLVASELSRQDDTGLFEVQIALKGEEEKFVKLILNYNVPLATQVSKLRRNIQTYFSACPVE